MKNKVNIWTILSAIVCVLLLVAEGLTVFRIWKLNMLPMKYLAVILPVLLIITVVLIFLLFPRATGKYQKNNGHTKQIVAYILSLVMALGCFIGYRMLTKLDETFNTITKQPSSATQIGVYVLSGDPAQVIEDTSVYKFGITDSYDANNTKIAVAGINKTLNTTIETTNFDTVLNMIDGLYHKDVQAVVLNTAYVSLLEDTEGYTDFSTKTRLLCVYEVTESDIPVETEEVTEPTEVIATEPPTLQQPFVMYLSGSDTRSAVLAQSRSDVNILAVVNPTTKQILLVNTPRDYYIPNPAGKGALDKLTHCGLYGTECSMKALSNLYNQPVTYSAQINFTGFETLIDAIGGISIHSEKGDGVYLKPGENRMNGKRALEFARNRYSYASGDHARGKHQMQVISAVVDKLTSGSIITNYSDILDSLQGMFVTSMPSDMISAYIKMQLSDMAHWDVFSYAVGGTGASKVTYSMPGVKASVVMPNKEDVARASKLIGQVLNGEKLTASDVA